MVLVLRAVLLVEILLVILLYHLHYNPHKMLTEQIRSNQPVVLQLHIHQTISRKILN